MSRFVFRSFGFEAGVARFVYESGGIEFVERVQFEVPREEYDNDVLERALYLAFLLVGTSYYKCFPTPTVVFETGQIDDWQAVFLNKVYQEGLSQFAFENQLSRRQLAQFETTGASSSAVSYAQRGKLVLQSGGKDSLLVAAMLERDVAQYHPWYCSSSTAYPALLDGLSHKLVVATRSIDRAGLARAAEQGALNGHVPVTYIISALALVQAILLGDNEVLLGIAREGEEPHAWVGDLPVNHQWSKTASAGQLFTEYVERYISPDIRVYSPLRHYSELRVAELFTEYAWERFGSEFSSCNVANYQQGANNQQLQWCGNCPKCANSYLLFSPFVEARELQTLFGGKDLYTDSVLQETFKGLLGVDGVMKPFECVGEINELRCAYHMAQQHDGYGTVEFEVPASTFDYRKE